MARSSTSQRPFRIALFGIFGHGNFGNDATLDACIAGLHPPLAPAEIFCVAPNPSYVSQRYGIAAATLASSKRFHRLTAEVGNLVYAWRILRRVRTFVIAGTGILDDQHVRPSQLPLEVLRWSVAARLAGARLVLLAVGAGPIDQTWSRRFLKAAAALAHEVSYRDRRSLEFMRGIGRDVRQDRVLPDLALSIEPSGHPTSAEARGAVAVGVLSQFNWRDRHRAYVDYENRLVALVEGLATDGREVLVVTGDEADADTQRSLLSRPELAGLPVRAVECHSFDDVLEAVSRCAAVVASRYHNLVAAVIAGVPVVSLSYGPKNGALLEDLGAPPWEHEIDEFEVEDVIAQIRVALSRETPGLDPALASCRRALREEFDRLTHD